MHQEDLLFLQFCVSSTAVTLCGLTIFIILPQILPLESLLLLRYKNDYYDEYSVQHYRWNTRPGDPLIEDDPFTPTCMAKTDRKLRLFQFLIGKNY